MTDTTTPGPNIGARRGVEVTVAPPPGEGLKWPSLDVLLAREAEHVATADAIVRADGVAYEAPRLSPPSPAHLEARRRAIFDAEEHIFELLQALRVLVGDAVVTPVQAAAHRLGEQARLTLGELGDAASDAGRTLAMLAGTTGELERARDLARDMEGALEAAGRKGTEHLADEPPLGLTVQR